MFKLHLLPRETQFFDLLEAASVNIFEAAGQLATLMDSFEEVEGVARGIKDLEHKGDNVTHQIMNELRQSFVTPLEREDIAALAHSLDDVVDCIEEASARLVMYRIQEPTATARKLAHIILQMAEEIQQAMPLLRHRGDMPRILPVTVEINRLENEADDALRRGLMELFEEPANVLHVLKWREIYELLEEATDRGEDVANALEGVVLKHA